MTISDLKNEVILKLLLSGKLRINQEIEYEQFLKIYSDYTYLPEIYFASILGSFRSFLQLKQKRSKMIVLKDFNISSVDLKSKILDDLFSKKMISYNKKISYEDFTEILYHYQFLDENVLASILDINTWTLQRIKYDRKANTVILKKKYFLTELEEQQVNNLINEKIIYPGKQIDYQFFLSLKKYFGDIKNSRLAYILEISPGMLHNLKEGKQKPIILKSRKESFVLGLRDDIIHELINERSAYKSENIDKNRFSELYEGYEYISEVDFAFYILGIKFNNFKSLKSQSTNAVILKHVYLFDDLEKENICKQVLLKFNLKEGDLINNDLFVKISDEYPNINDDMLCSILGISWPMFCAMRYNGKKIGIYNGVVREKTYFMKKHFLEDRFYSKEEIESVLNNYNVTLGDFVCYFINNRRYFHPEDYIEAMQINGGLFIGKFNCSNEFIENSYDLILNSLKPLIFKLGGRNFLFSREDILQQCILHLYQSCGDLERNFSFTHKVFDKMASRIERIIKGMLIDLYHSRVLEVSIDNERFFSKPSDKNPILIDKEQDTFEKAVHMSEDENDIYGYTISLIEEGHTLEETIEILVESYSDLSENDILKLLKEELIKREKVKQKIDF